MVAFLRFLRILITALRYRLDELLPKHKLPLALRLLLSLTFLLPASKMPRGERLRHFFEDLGPVFIKFGQLLSTRPDLIEQDIVCELDHLQDNVAPFDQDLCREMIEEALGAPVDELFAEFERAPLASASVAQVHTAKLHSGEDVVVKVIRPGIEHTIEKDVQLLFALARLVEKYVPEGKRLRPVEVVGEYEHTIFDELNLQREAANASQLRRNFDGSAMLYVPQVYWDYTRKNVMVMERIYGIPVTNTDELAAQNTNMKALAENGVEIFFTQVFDHNFFHADMHPGNIFVSRDNPQQPQYIAVDMAIVGSLTQEDQYYMARNLLAIFQRDYRLVAELHVQSGWVSSDTPVNEFEAAIRCVCEPIFEKPLKEISFGQVVINLFQTAQRFNMEVQPQLVLLQKTLLNIEGLGRQLYPDLDLWKTAHPFLEKWLKDRLHPRSFAEQLKRHAPQWLEQFPLVPQLIFNALENTRTLAEAAPELQRAAKQLQQGPRRGDRRTLVAVIAAAGAGITALPAFGISLAQLPQASLLLGGIAAWLLISR